MRSINYNSLHAFWLVARHGSFAAAAASLPWGSAQSLHKRVRQLESEEHLDLKLLHSRGVKGVELTEAGRRIYELVDPVFRTLVDLLEDARNEDSGLLPVALTSYVARNFADEILREFRIWYPKVATKVYSGDGPAVISLVESGEALAGVCVVFRPLPKSMRIHARAAVQFEILAPVEWKLSEKDMTWPSLVQRPFVVSDRRGMLRQALEHVLRQENLLSQLQVGAEAATLDLMISAVKAGYGLAYIPVDQDTDLRMQRITRFSPPTHAPEIAKMVISKHGAYLPHYMAAFIEVAAKVVGCDMEC